MGVMKELWSEANDAFYDWEKVNGRADLSDDARVIWCEGYVLAVMRYMKQNETEEN